MLKKIKPVLNKDGSAYQLFNKKDEAKIIVEKMKPVFNDVRHKVNERVWKYNDNYYFSLDKKKLLELAEELKNKWISEAELLLEKYNSIKIQSR